MSFQRGQRVKCLTTFTNAAGTVNAGDIGTVLGVSALGVRVLIGGRVHIVQVRELERVEEEGQDGEPAPISE